MKRYLLIVITALTCLVGARTYAHHSFAATYREKETVTIEGDLIQLDFRNPHSFVHVDVNEKDGTKVRYAVEWGSSASRASRARRSRSVTTSSSRGLPAAIPRTIASGLSR